MEAQAKGYRFGMERLNYWLILIDLNYVLLPKREASFWRLTWVEPISGYFSSNSTRTSPICNQRFLPYHKA